MQWVSRAGHHTGLDTVKTVLSYLLGTLPYLLHRAVNDDLGYKCCEN